MQDWSGIAGHWGLPWKDRGYQRRGVLAGGVCGVFGKMIVRPILLYSRGGEIPFKRPP